jgi:uncharacterized protein (TIGR00299 family) protein
VKIAYFDCYSGISGDMCLGALVDAGLSVVDIEKQLRKLRLTGYRLTSRRVRRAGITATKVDVMQKAKGSGMSGKARTWHDIKKIITASQLPDHTKKKGQEIFKRLFEAEARVHGRSWKTMHLHELGATDCLVDIFGTLIGLDLLGIEQVYASPVNVGGGTVKTAHGTLPVPAPATADIIQGMPVYSSDASCELTTPTGAAILRLISAGYGELPLMMPDVIGYGAGSRNMKDRPNVLRIFAGYPYEQPSHEKITVIETNIDDMNPQIYEYLIDALFSAGARDVYLTPVMMKKTRPGIKLSVLCDADRKNDLIEVILKETTTIGVRYHEVGRMTMERTLHTVTTKYGKVVMKKSRFGEISKNMPEYEACKKIARKAGVPLSEVMAAVQKTFKKNEGDKKLFFRTALYRKQS